MIALETAAGGALFRQRPDPAGHKNRPFGGSLGAQDSALEAQARLPRDCPDCRPACPRYSAPGAKHHHCSGQCSGSTPAAPPSTTIAPSKEMENCPDCSKLKASFPQQTSEPPRTSKKKSRYVIPPSHRPPRTPRPTKRRMTSPGNPPPREICRGKPR